MTVISDFIYKLQENPRRLEILGDGKQAKSYPLSSECVDAMLYIVDRASAGMNAYNLGCEDSLSVTRIAQMARETGPDRGGMGARRVLRRPHTGSKTRLTSSHSLWWKSR